MFFLLVSYEVKKKSWSCWFGELIIYSYHIDKIPPDTKSITLVLTKSEISFNIFPTKPRSTARNRIDNSRIFLELDYINNVRNRIAHHEPICFGNPVGIDTNYALTNYARMMTLFQWMAIDANRLMYGLDHVGEECGKIMCI